MQHAGPGRRTGCPKQLHPRCQGMFSRKACALPHPGQEVGLLLLHQHGPADGLLKAAAAPMPLATGEHDRAWAHLERAPLEHLQIGLGVSGTIHQQIAIAAIGPALQQPAATSLAFATGREQPQPRNHLLGRAAGFGGLGEQGQGWGGGGWGEQGKKVWRREPQQDPAAPSERPA